MKVTKTETITETRTVTDYHMCDICSKKRTNWSDWPSTTEKFNTNETEIRLKQGNAWPSGGNGTEIEVDICPECFRQKLIPWLESQCVIINETEWDF